MTKESKIKGREHDEFEVLASLKKKKDVKVTGTLVQILKSQIWSDKAQALVHNPGYTGDVGNGTWGKIDFLVNHCGYQKLFTGKFSF